MNEKMTPNVADAAIDEVTSEEKRVKKKEPPRWRVYLYYLLCVLIPLIICTKVIILGSVPTSSMEPTIRAGEFVVCNRLAVRDGVVERGDIVAFQYGEIVLFKRVIGVPGDVITFDGAGGVYVDDIRLDESAYIPEDVFTDAPYPVYAVPEGHYFLMGDNRENSDDCRFWAEPFVPAENLLGVHMFGFYLPIYKF